MNNFQLYLHQLEAVLPINSLVVGFHTNSCTRFAIDCGLSPYRTKYPVCSSRISSCLLCTLPLDRRWRFGTGRLLVAITTLIYNFRTKWKNLQIALAYRDWMVWRVGGRSRILTIFSSLALMRPCLCISGSKH